MNILLLGATGSIGKSVLSVIEQNKSSLNLFGIALNKNTLESNKIIHSFSPAFVYIENKDAFEKQKKIDKTTFLNGDSELKDLINHEDVDVIVCAISGFAGLKATHLAASSGKRISVSYTHLTLPTIE